MRFEYLPNLSYEEKEALASDFCEEDIELKSLLLFLWNNNINSYGCCAGHDNDGDSNPYIFFDITNINDVCFVNFIQTLLTGPLKHKIEEVSVSKNMFQTLRNGFSLHFKNREMGNFEYLEKALKNSLNNRIEEEAVSEQLKFYLNSCVWLKNLDANKYQKKYQNLDVNIYEHITFGCKDDNLFLIAYKYNPKYTAILKKEDGYKIRVQKDYFTLDKHGDFYTLDSGKLKKLSCSEAKIMPRLIIDNRRKTFDIESFNYIKSEIEIC